MGLGTVNDAAEWDFVEYGKALRVHNARQKELMDKSDDNVEELGGGDTLPPSLEWMMADDQRLANRGYEVN